MPTLISYVSYNRCRMLSHKRGVWGGGENQSNMSLDSTYQIAIWTIIETGLGITAGSLITLRPLFRWLLDGSMSYGRNGRAPERSSGRYRLSSFKHDGAKHSQDPNLWRPDTDANTKTLVEIASSPRSQVSSDANSSQEALNPGPISSGQRSGGVTVERSFVQVVSERES